MRARHLVSALLVDLVVAQGEIPSHCCTALYDAGLGEAIVSSASVTAFSTNLQKYFSRGAVLKPQCFFQPRDTTEVSLAVKALVEANKTQSCQFAVRSGGHTSFAGAAGIENGVTFDLGYLNDIQYYESNKSVSVGPGAVWGDVYQALDKIGVMVTGGRSSSVGVGGLTLGGGNSFYAARYGFVCDNVLQFEVVLADGSIVTANKDDHSDLFQALKGGSNNFGIVTRYDYLSFEGGDIFGGVVLYPGNTSDQHLEAIVNFGDKIKDDPYGSAIVIGAFMSDTKTPLIMNAYEYTKKVERPEGEIFQEFFAIPGNLSDSTGLRNMTSLAYEFENTKDHRVSFSTLTFKNDIKVVKKAHELFLNVTAKLEAEATGDYAIYTLYQPIPTLFAKHGLDNGGNVLGLDRFDDNLILYEPYLKWQGEEQDDLFNSQAKFLRDEISAYAKSIGSDNPWLYLNYADGDQQPLEGYGEDNVQKIRDVAAKYDPHGVFQQMVPGGFKISKVNQTAATTSGAISGTSFTVVGGVVGAVAGIFAIFLL